MNRSNIISLIAVVVAGISILMTCNTNRGTDTTLQQSVRDLIWKDSIAAIERTTIRNMRTIDSIRIAGIIIELGYIPEKIEEIKKNSNEKKNHLINLPIDSQVSYMSTWLSQEGSYR